MAKLNEVKYIYMSGEVGETNLKLNELEHKWLEMTGATPGRTLGEKWMEVFNKPGKNWTGAAHAWLTDQGIPAGGKLNERFYLYWATGGSGGPVIPPPPLIGMGAVWKRVTLNDWIWTPGVEQYPALTFGPIKPGKPYTVAGTVTAFTGAGNCAVRLGEEPTNTFLITGLGDFFVAAPAGTDNSLLRFIIQDNVSMTAFRIENIRLREIFGASGTGVLRLSGSDYRIGTVNGAPDAPVPDNIAGLEIYWLGSFGQNTWNLRLGPTGTDQLAGVNLIRVHLGNAEAANLVWSGVNQRYEATTTQDLWAILGPDVDTVIDYDIAVI